VDTFRTLSQDLPERTGGNHGNSVQIAENWVKKYSYNLYNTKLEY
jgi:hypothetical protein